MARGKSKAEYLPINKPIEDKETAGKILSDMLPLLDLKPDRNKPAVYSDPVLLEKAITDYFRYCAAKGLRPGIMGLCAAIGMSYRDYQNEKQGLTHVISNDCLSLLKRAHMFIESYIEQAGAAGVLNTVLTIFWQKNFSGLSDSQDITISPRADITATKTLDQLEQDIPIDETETP